MLPPQGSLEARLADTVLPLDGSASDLTTPYGSQPELGEAPVPGGVGEAAALKAEVDGLDGLGGRGYYNEALDQLLVEVLLGAR